MSTKTIPHSVRLEDGSTLFGLIKGDKLLLRRVKDERHLAVNLTPADVDKLGIMLCKFLEASR